MNVCKNCGAENFNLNQNCLICGEPLDIGMQDNSDSPSDLYSYETDQSYFMTRLYPIAFLFVLIAMCLPAMLMPTPLSFRVLWILAALFMIVMTISYYWLYPTITIENDHIKLKTVFDEYIIKPEQVKNIVDIDMMFMPNRLRVDLESGPCFYRLNGLLFGAWGKPMFLINKDIRNFAVLQQLLIDMTGIKPQKVIL